MDLLGKEGDILGWAVKPLKWKNISIFIDSGFLNEGEGADIF